MPAASSLRELMEIRKANRTLLDRFNGTLGTALGFKRRTGQMPSREPAIVVFVPRKVNPVWLPDDQKIPSQLKGPRNLTCPLDVVESRLATEDESISVPRNEMQLAEDLRGWSDELWAGSQLAAINPNGKESLGTLGAFAENPVLKTFGFITNRHVAFNFGTRIFHPYVGMTLLGTSDISRITIEDEKWYGPFTDEPRTFVRVDAAYVEFDKDFYAKHKAKLNPELKGIGELGIPMKISLDDLSIIGQTVHRVGRTTGVREGQIEFFGYEFKDGQQTTVYTDFVVRGKNGPFSARGDSGSLIVGAGNRPLGLLWGGRTIETSF